MPEIPDSRDDAPLDENLSRLLGKDEQRGRPSMSRQREAEMLAALQTRQAELSDAEEKPMDAVINPPASTSSRASLLVAGTIAAAAVVGLTALFLSPAPEPAPRPAPDSQTGAVAGEPKVERLSGDLVRHTLEDGSKLIARAGSKYTIDGPRRLTLRQGSIYLIVAKSEQPLVVKTSDGEVLATGTRFAVSVEDATTTAAVAQGRVTLRGDEGKVALRPGEQGSLSRGEAPTRSPAPRLSHLVSWARDALAMPVPLVEGPEAEDGLVAVDPWGQESKLTLRKYHVDVHIEDGIARTTIDQTFFNHYPWNTEGTFYFPLPPDASVSRLAMYVGGDLNEGGMVDRDYGQTVYNEIRYQNRDPALLEMMEGNIFKMRIFPLEGRQEKRIFLSYTQEVEELYGVQRYWFPMDHTHSIANQLSIRVRIKDGAEGWSPQSSTHDLNSRTDGDDLVLEYKTERTRPDQDLLLHLAPSGEQPASRLTTASKDGYEFVFGRFSPRLTGHEKSRPRQWIVLNDVSASRTSIEAQAQRHIVERLVQEADDEDSLAIIDLNTRAVLAEHRGGRGPLASMSQLRRSGIASEPPKEGPALVWPQRQRIGGTNFQAGLRAAGKLIEQHQLDNPHLLYLGDGVATDGITEVAGLVRAIPAKCVFLGVGVGKKVDARFLQEAADHTQGTFTTINPDEDIDWRVFDLVAALNTPRLTGLSVEMLDADGRLMNSLAYPSARTLAAGETLSIVARSDQKPAKVALRGRLAGKPWHAEHALDKSTDQADYLPRLWAKRRLDELLKSGPEEHKQEIISLSKQYYVVTPLTSLIVLENDAMYEQYKVERGRKDHWALYPAPKQIDVVAEPIDWSFWGRNTRGEDEQVEAKLKPQTAQEVVDSVQVRINAPFYLWQPRPDQHSRFAIYRLLDSEADPSRLLMYSLSAAAEDQDGMRLVRGQTADGGDAEERAARFTKLHAVEELMAAPLLLENVERLPAVRTQMMQSQLTMPRLEFELADFRLVDLGRNTDGWLDEDWYETRSPLIASGGILLAPLQMNLPPISNPEPLTMNFSGQALPATLSVASGFVSPRLLESYERAVRERSSRLSRDIRRFNLQYGAWHGRSWSSWRAVSGVNLDFDDLGGDIYGGLSELLKAKKKRAMPLVAAVATSRRPRSANVVLLPNQLSDELNRVPTVALAFAYGRAMKHLPGSTAVLAADHLGAARDQLLAKPNPTEAEQRELKAVQRSLGNLEEASVRLEEMAPFWNGQGWSYSPKTAQFEPPIIQAYHGYTWAYDVTRYAPGLYSNSLDILNEVAEQVPQPAAATKPGRVDKDARQRIADARRSIRPVRLTYANGLKVDVGARDRLAVTETTSMNLRQRMVCDGNAIYHIYDELGLAGRREASELRMGALRQLAPHLLEPADALAQRFDIALDGATDDGFQLRLTPRSTDTTRVASADDSPDETAAKKKAEKLGDDEQVALQITMRVLNDGRVRDKVVTLDGERLLAVDHQYEGDNVVLRWIDKDGKQFATTKFSAQPLDEGQGEQALAVDLAPHVVFDMPLRKPAFYRAQLEELDEDMPLAEIGLKRHLALAELQELQWRRWTQVNSTVVEVMTEVGGLLQKQGRPLKLGDLCLMGASGTTLPDQVLKGNKAYRDDEPLALYFQHRRRSSTGLAALADQHPDTLSGHFASYHEAIRHQQPSPSLEQFIKSYPDSPLILAAAYYCSQWGKQPEPWLMVCEHSSWRPVALMMSAHLMKTDDHAAQFVKHFKQWRDELVELGYDAPINDAVFKVLKRQGEWSQILDDKWQRARQSQQIAPVLFFAEQALKLGEQEAGDRALKLANELLAKQPSLLGKLALAQVLWAGDRPEQAYPLYTEILESLRAKHITPSPGLLAAAARLAHQAGKLPDAISLEEQSLAAEHPYLPQMINIHAFRQRYQWLWDQSLAQIEASKGQQDLDDWVRRAERTWRQWYEVDRDNQQLPRRMADLQSSVGRDAEAWMYLSSVVDLRPKDASSHALVANWHRGRGERDAAQQRFAEAHRCDTANPQWLMERAQVLVDMKDVATARQVLRQVSEGQWAPALQSHVGKAKQLLKTLPR